MTGTIVVGAGMSGLVRAHAHANRDTDPHPNAVADSDTDSYNISRVAIG